MGSIRDEDLYIDIGYFIISDQKYDDNGRLTEVKKNGIIVESYTYDANGNRLTDGSRTYGYSAEDHLINAGSNSHLFDGDGFLTQKTTSAGTLITNYSSRGELLSATLPSGTVITYDHDPIGRRVAKRVDGTITEKYLWKDIVTLLAVYDGSDNLLMRFNYADGRLPVSMIKGGNTYYLLYDQIGTLKAVSDSFENIIKQLDYDSFGNIISDTNPGFIVPFGFAGGLHDRDTGLVRFGARDYDPSIGRWTAKDPIDFAGGDTNLYGYVNDPVNLVDPTGEFASVIGGAIGGAIAGGVAGGIVGGVSSFLSGDSISGVVNSAIVGAGIGAVVGGVAGGLAGAGIVGPLGLAAGDFAAGFNVGLGVGEGAALSSRLGAVAGLFSGIFTDPGKAYGSTSNPCK